MGNYYVKHLACLLVLLFSALLSPFLYAETPYNKIVFFGDSLSDNGNLYWVDFGYLPKSPPYYEGRLSNGPVWSEQLANDLYEKRGVTTLNYAVAGETTLFHNPIKGYLPYSLNLSLDTYLLRTILRDRSTTLFVIWIGANDYLPGSKNPDQLTTDVVENIKSSIERLIYHGGVNFLVINLPDLALTPYGRESKISQTLSRLITQHNIKLQVAISDIQTNYKSINMHLYDLNTLFVDLVNNPDRYNKKYQIHLTNTKTACWPGGFTLGRVFNQTNIAQQFQEKIKSRSISLTNQNPLRNQFDVDGFAQYIATSPALSEAYRVSDAASSGVNPCNNPNEYIFWDHIHPTAVIHTLLFQEITNYVTQHYLSVG